MVDTVNPQVTDAITQGNLCVLGQAAAQATAVQMQASAHAAGLRLTAQHTAASNMSLLRQAVVARAAAALTP